MDRSDSPADRVRQARVRRARQALQPAAVPPAPQEVPIDPERTSLYSPAELYGTGPYAGSLDARTYAWSLAPGDRHDHLARALHDHAIDEALAAWLPRRRLVGVMGGHDARRGDPAYAEAARLGHGLGAAGLVVATGGGPGAMEAANLGCLLANLTLDEVATAVAALARVPAFRPVDDWLDAARTVLSRPGALPHPSTRSLHDSLQHSLHDSLGVPTWFYGHEPTNIFVTAIAKYFRNALRESILLQLCDAGIVFLPGAAGTVQEVFQDACENYYATPDRVAPMVLVGVRFWTSTLPAWPLLQALARHRPMTERMHLVDTVEEAVTVLAH